MELNDSTLLIEPTTKEAQSSPRNSSQGLSTNNTSEEEKPIDWREKALNRDFMPAVVKLDRGEIDVNEEVDPNTGNRLIHLATYNGFLNVVRTLHEIFKCDLGIANKYGHTVLHMLCSVPNLNLHLFYFLIKYNKELIHQCDSKKVPPLFYTVMSKQNVQFLYLLSLGADPYSLDGYENNILYWAIFHGNLFATKFILSNLEIDINIKFFKINPAATKDVCDLLISSKSNACCKYIAKYKYTELDLGSIQNMILNFDKNTFYNIKNYEILVMLYHYKLRSHLRPLVFISVICNLNFTFYCLNYYFTLYIRETKQSTKFCFLFMFLLLKILFLKDLLTTINIYPSLITFSLLFINFVLLLKLMFIPSKAKVINAKKLREENVINEVNQKFKTDLFSMFFEEEICEICLIRKDIYTNHCNICNKCVDRFHFHSLLFNCCIGKHNLRSYFYYELSNYLICLSLLLLFYFRVRDSHPRANVYLLTNIMLIFTTSSFTDLSIYLLFFLSMIYSLQRILVLLVCLGYETTYFMIFRTHKLRNDFIQLKNKYYHFTVDTNKFTFFQALRNLLRNL